MALMITYAIFAAGFASRPIGALIFGYLGDKYGRLVPLKITPLLITFCTVVLAFLPTYGSIGNIATLLLLLTRILQGILLGGEFAGNIIYLCESSKKSKYFWGSIGSCTGSFGILLASMIASTSYNLFNHNFMYSYGWRLAFLLSVPLGITAFFMRWKMPESPEFSKVNNYKNPIITSFTRYKKTLFYCLGLICLHATSFYFVFMFLPIFLTKIRHLHESAALINNASFLALHLFFIPIFGIVVEFVGGLRAMIIISLIFTLSTTPIFYFIANGTEPQILVSLTLFSILTAINAAIVPGLLSEIITVNVRYTILALIFNVGFGVFGGIMPFLGLLLIDKGGSIMLPGVYLTCASLVTFITACILLKPENIYEVRKIQSY